MFELLSPFSPSLPVLPCNQSQKHVHTNQASIHPIDPEAVMDPVPFAYLAQSLGQA